MRTGSVRVRYHLLVLLRVSHNCCCHSKLVCSSINYLSLVVALNEYVSSFTKDFVLTSLKCITGLMLADPSRLRQSLRHLIVTRKARTTLLGNGNLKVSKIIQKRNTNASLAFLSACETAKGDKGSPDEAMHLAATMLFAGFCGVVGTMWSV